MDQFISYLEQKLQDPLPGADPHKLLVPKLANGQRLNFKSNSAPRMSAVLILFYSIDGQLHFPLIQRPEYPGVHSGQIALPGGKKEKSDKNLIGTAIREANEEIGISVESIDIIGTLTEYYVSASNFNILPVIGTTSSKPHFIAEEKEVAEIIEAPLLSVVDKNIKKKVMNIRGVDMLIPYYDIKGKVVWGATAMILSELSAILKGHYQLPK